MGPTDLDLFSLSLIFYTGAYGPSGLMTLPLTIESVSSGSTLSSLPFPHGDTNLALSQAGIVKITDIPYFRGCGFRFGNCAVSIRDRRRADTGEEV